MSDAIDMDPVILERLLDKAIGQNKAQYDALPEVMKAMIREQSKSVLQDIHGMLEREREQTIDHVLKVFDVAAQTKSIPFIRDAIVRFKTI